MASETRIGPNNEIVHTRLQVTEQLGGTTAATAANYGCIFIADRAYELMGMQESHQTAGSDGGAVTLMAKKCTAAQAPSAGTDMLSAGMNLKSTADTPVSASLSATAANRRLAAGDRIALVTTGTLTALAGVHVSLALKPI